MDSRSEESSLCPIPKFLHNKPVLPNLAACEQQKLPLNFSSTCSSNLKTKHSNCEVTCEEKRFDVGTSIDMELGISSNNVSEKAEQATITDAVGENRCSTANLEPCNASPAVKNFCSSPSKSSYQSFTLNFLVFDHSTSRNYVVTCQLQKAWKKAKGFNGSLP